MGSPHNPALSNPASPPPTLLPPLITSLVGVGGTMASSTPISPTEPVALVQPRKLSFSRKYTEDQGPRTPSRSRSGSAGSIRTAIRLPRREEVARVRKESIGVPRMVGGGFEDRFEGDGSVEGMMFGVGEAI
jgi:hypothetical protein